MTDLLTRLEGDAAGSRELDAEVWAVLFMPKATRIEIEKSIDGGYPREIAHCNLGSAWADQLEPSIGHYTTSIDAAVAFAERVLGEEGALEVLEDVVIDVRMDTSNGCLKSIPLALCAAIIRAHAEQVQG